MSSPTYGTLTLFRQNSLTLDAVFEYDPFSASYGFSPMGFQGTAAAAAISKIAVGTRHHMKFRVDVGYMPGGSTVAVRRLCRDNTAMVQISSWLAPIYQHGARASIGDPIYS